MSVPKRMLFTRTSAVLVGGGILAAVIASPALMRTTTLRPTEPVRPFPVAAGATVVEPTRVAALLARQAQAVQASRNPFAFATRPQQAAPEKLRSAPAITAAPADPPRPTVSLSAIAEQTADDGVLVRTAVLSIGGQVFLAKEGEHATPRFTVVRLTTDVAELRDEATGIIFRVALR